MTHAELLAHYEAERSSLRDARDASYHLAAQALERGERDSWRFHTRTAESYGRKLDQVVGKLDKLREEIAAEQELEDFRANLKIGQRVDWLGTGADVHAVYKHTVTLRRFGTGLADSDRVVIHRGVPKSQISPRRRRSLKGAEDTGAAALAAA